MKESYLAAVLSTLIARDITTKLYHMNQKVRGRGREGEREREKGSDGERKADREKRGMDGGKFLEFCELIKGKRENTREGK